MFGSGDLGDQGVFGGQHHVGGAKNGIRPGSKDRDFLTLSAAALNLKNYFRTLRRIDRLFEIRLALLYDRAKVSKYLYKRVE